MAIIMSGIVGFTNVDLTQDTQGQAIRKMVRELKHRGSDGQEIWINEHIAMGCAYFGARQPFNRKIGERELVVTFDGAIYNGAELREELDFEFRGDSDVELVFAAYMQWGEECVGRLRGVFAFAIWDASERKLMIARDRIGVKPLFFTEFGGRLIWASEIKGILSYPEFEAVIDEEGIAEIFGLGPTRTPGSGVFSGIKELETGSYLTYSDGALQMKRYWELVSAEHGDDLGATAEKLRYLVKDSVVRHMGGGEPIASLLSGGLDSSAVSAIVAKEMGKEKLATYSFDYRGNDEHFMASTFQPDSDRKWAAEMSKWLGTEHKVLYADTGDLTGALYEAVKARDLPGMADIDSSLLYFCRELKRDYNVVLSGEGADEILGGYPWFHSAGGIENEGFPWIRGLAERVKFLQPEVMVGANVEAYVKRRYAEAIAKTPRLEGENERAARRRELFYLNLTWFAANLLERKDRMSMASGLEARMPFVDHELIEYVWNIPWTMKALGGREKGVLRLALKGILPESILERKKSPFPKTHNPEYERVVKRELMEILNDSNSRLNELVDRSYIEGHIAKKEKESTPFFGQLMGRPQLYAFLLQVNFWLEHYKVGVRLSR